MTKLQTPPPACETDEISFEEELRLAEAEAQKSLGISFEDFKQRWYAGEYRNNPNPKITHVAFYLH